MAWAVHDHCKRPDGMESVVAEQKEEQYDPNTQGFPIKQPPCVAKQDKTELELDGFILHEFATSDEAKRSKEPVVMMRYNTRAKSKETQKTSKTSKNNPMKKTIQKKRPVLKKKRASKH